MGLPSSALGGSLPMLTLLFLSYSYSSEAYLEKIVENDSVCSLNFLPNVIYLQGFEEKSALIMKDSRYFKKWTGHQEFKCQFVISSSPSSGLGLFAVIQRMSLRRDEEGNCIDYVKFRRAEKTLNLGEFHFKIKSSESWSPEICGKMNSLEVNVDDDKYNDISKEDNDKEITNSFIDHRGLIEVKIVIAGKSLKPGEEISFEFVFTSFQAECKSDHGLWKTCGGRTCIYKEFFKDGKLNCPYKSCKDENGCQAVISVLNGNGYHFNTTFGTKIMAGTVAGLLTMFVAFIAFLWIFRHCGSFLCCIGYSNSHPHSSEMQRVPNLDTMTVMATAPPDSLVASGTDVRAADKDLPPSYESLFPSK